MYFLVDEEEKCREKQLYSTVWENKPKSWKKMIFFFFLMNEQNFETFFFFLIKLNIFFVVLFDTTLSQRNLSGKLLHVGKK